MKHGTLVLMNNTHDGPRACLSVLVPSVGDMAHMAEGVILLRVGVPIEVGQFCSPGPH